VVQLRNLAAVHAGPMAAFFSLDPADDALVERLLAEASDSDHGESANPFLLEVQTLPLARTIENRLLYCESPRPPALAWCSRGRLRPRNETNETKRNEMVAATDPIPASAQTVATNLRGPLSERTVCPPAAHSRNGSERRRLPPPPGHHTAMKKLRIVILGSGTARQKMPLNDGQIQNPSARLYIVPLSNFVPRGFGFVHHSIAILYHQVPNLSITIRNFFIAVHHATHRNLRGLLGHASWTLAGSRVGGAAAGGRSRGVPPRRRRGATAADRAAGTHTHPCCSTRFAASLRTDISPQRKEAQPLSHALTSD
jgi:hypothetical protein